jgi:hypothetical protein
MSKFFRILPSLLLIALLGIAACNKSGTLKDTPPEVKLYQVKSAKIVYVYSGPAKGTLTDIIANYGMYETKSSDVVYTMNGTQSHIRRMDIQNDSLTYVVDLDKKTGLKSRSELSMMKQIVTKLSPEQKANFTLENLLHNGAERVGKESILGKECDVLEFKMQSMKIWLWKGIAMKQEHAMGTMKMVIAAKSIDADFSASADMFEPPKDIKIEDQTNVRAPHPPMGKNPH